MQTRSLGNTGLRVSPLGYGAGSLGDPSLDDRQVDHLLHRVLEVGINLFDAARSYGLAEQRLGRFLKPNRDSIILSTKVGYGIEGVPDWTYEAVARGIDEALKRLDTEVLDIVHLHSCPRWMLERGEVVDALVHAKAAGKLRAAGYSGENEALAWALSSGRFDVVQCSVNVLERRGYDPPGNPSAAPLGVLAKRPLANAVWRHQTCPEREDLSEYWRRWESLALDEVLGVDPADAVLRFTAYAPGVTSALVATVQPDRLEANAASVARGPLPEDVHHALEARFRARGQAWGGLI